MVVVVVLAASPTSCTHTHTYTDTLVLTQHHPWRGCGVTGLALIMFVSCCVGSGVGRCGTCGVGTGGSGSVLVLALVMCGRVLTVVLCYSVLVLT